MADAINRNRAVVGVGSNVVDVIYRVNRIAGPEEKTYILPDEAGSVVTELPGGVTLNHLAWAALLGVPAGLFEFQGGDRYGAMIREEMDRHGIDRSAVRVLEGRASGFSVVNVAADADRAIYMARALTAETTAGDVETYFAEYIRAAAMVTTEISQLPLDAVIAAMRIAREAGAMTVLDVDVPPDFAVEVAGLGSAGDLEEALRLADVVKPAKAAALQMVEADSSEERAELLLKRYDARLVAITEGAQGSVVTDGKQTIRSPAKPVAARDTTGAGDAFLGGLIAGLYHGFTLQDTASLANAAGAVCCGVPGAFPILETSRNDVIALYEGPPIPAGNGPAGDAPAGSAPEVLPGAETDRVATESADSALSGVSGTVAPETVAPGTASGAIGLDAVRKTAEALARLHEGMSHTYFDEVVSIIRNAEAAGGRVHVSGVGKSRHIARKLAATLQSTGTPAYFLDPTDCNHGDSGQAARGDVVVAFSHSGETEELLAAAQTLVANGATIIAITGNRSSRLARSSAATLYVPVASEAGPLGLAPTASTSCQLAVADGLAMALKADRGFTREDFARYHPGGQLGRRLQDGAVECGQ